MKTERGKKKKTETVEEREKKGKRGPETQILGKRGGKTERGKERKTERQSV